MSWSGGCPIWGLHPEVVVSHTFSLDQASEAYGVADGGRSGKVAIVFDQVRLSVRVGYFRE